MAILIITATALEQDNLRQNLRNTTTRTFAYRNFTQGDLANHTVTLLETGIGTVNTAQALTALLETDLPDLVLQIGVGGAYLPANLNVGDLALATEETYGDLGILTPTGWQSADTIGIPILHKTQEYYNTFPLDNTLVSKTETILHSIPWPSPAPTILAGPFVTVQECSGLATRGNELAARFNAICENMEGTAAAHICTLYEIPFLELRAISNLVEDRNKEAWNLPLAAQRAQQAASAIVENLKIIHS